MGKVWVLAVIGCATLCMTPGIRAAHQSNTSEQSTKADRKALVTGTDEGDLAAMSGDLDRMRALLSQMQNNLAFVGNNTSPLNHQFQLEIDMWRVLINQMERRIQRMQRNPTKSPK